MEAGRRKIKSGAEYDHLFPRALMINDTYKKGARLSDTLRLIPKIVRQTKWQVEGISKVLKGKDVHETCRNIWNFVYQHINYRKDDEGKEQIRSSARTWADRFLGVDCDCYTVFICSILSVLRIRYRLRITKYSQNHFQHIYPIVPLANGEYITVDCVVNRFDYEEPYSENKDMELEILSGIGNISKPYNDAEAHADLGRILKRIAEKKTASVAKKKNINPSVIQSITNAAAKSPQVQPQGKRPLVVKPLPVRSSTTKPSPIKPSPVKRGPLKPAAVKRSPVKLSPAKPPAPVQAGKKKKPTGVKKLLKKVEKVGKKVLHVANKIPLSALRAGLLAAMKLNAGKVAESLRWTYLTDAQASSKQAEMPRFNQLKKTRERLDKIFFTAGGKPANLKAAILKGKGNSDKAVALAGFDDDEQEDFYSDIPLLQLIGPEIFEDENLSGLGDLGNPAGIASAATVIAKIAAMIKKIGNIFPKKDKGNAQAPEESIPTVEEINTSIQQDEPAIEIEASTESAESSESETSSSTAVARRAESDTSTSASQGSDEEKDESESKALPATANQKSPDDAPPGGFVMEDKLEPAGKDDKPAPSANSGKAALFWEKNKSWLKPVGIGVGAIGLAYLGYKMMKPSQPKQSKTLSGVVVPHKKRKKHKLKAKKKVTPLALM